MSFVSIAFLALFAVASVLRATVGRSGRGEAYELGLYALSLVFYGWHVPGYLALILASTAVDFVAGRAIEATSVTQRRKAWLVGSLLLNLGLLGTFKYLGWLSQVVSALAAALGLDVRAPVVALVLPIGISFYTFQSMSYTVDVYRGKLAAERSFWRFGLYVAFFPQLVAGPIVRASEFLYQLPRRRPLRGRVVAWGAYLILRGLFLKLVVADNLGLLVDEHWGAASAPAASPALAASLLVFFSCQLFCDFAGYSDIARGLAYGLGFRLPVNFAAPFVATSFRDFWRRWHITLSQWFRDYVYIPLGGNRRGRARGLANLLGVMTLCGLWHGANATFVVWGVLHGVAAATERLLPRLRLPGHALLGLVAVQSVWILSMGVFRSADLGQASGILQNAVAFASTSTLPDDWASIATGWWFTVPVWALHARTALAERSARAPGALERAVYAGFMAYALLTLYATPRGFVYFQF